MGDKQAKKTPETAHPVARTTVTGGTGWWARRARPRALRRCKPPWDPVGLPLHRPVQTSRPRFGGMGFG